MKDFRSPFLKKVDSLSSRDANFRSPDLILKEAENVGKYSEEVAILSLKPERLAQYWLIAHLTLKVDFSKDLDLTATIVQAYQTFLENNCDKLVAILPTAEELEPAKSPYEKYYKRVREDLKQCVGKFVDTFVENQKLPLLPQVEAGKEKYAGVVGGVAVGKTAAEKKARAKIGASAAFVSSDEWHDVLVQLLFVENEEEKKQFQEQGASTLAEAWFIKEYFFELYKESSLRPHIIQEAMNIHTLRAPSHGGIVYLNTANPLDAIERAEKRGKDIQRFVDSPSVVSSYRLQFGRLMLGMSGFALAECHKEDVAAIKKLVEMKNDHADEQWQGLSDLINKIDLTSDDFHHLSFTQPQAELLKKFLNENQRGDISAKLLYRLCGHDSKLEVLIFDTDQAHPKRPVEDQALQKRDVVDHMYGRDDEDDEIKIIKVDVKALAPFATLKQGKFSVNSIGRLATFMSLEDVVRPYPPTRDLIWTGAKVNMPLVAKRLAQMAEAGIQFEYQGKEVSLDELVGKMGQLNKYVRNMQSLFRAEGAASSVKAAAAAAKEGGCAAACLPKAPAASS